MVLYLVQKDDSHLMQNPQKLSSPFWQKRAHWLISDFKTRRADSRLKISAASLSYLLVLFQRYWNFVI